MFYARQELTDGSDGTDDADDAHLLEVEAPAPDLLPHHHVQLVQQTLQSVSSKHLLSNLEIQIESLSCSFGDS